MKKRLLLVISLVLIVFLLSFSLVSASWFSDFWNKITGRGISGKVVESWVEVFSEDFSSDPNTNGKWAIKKNGNIDYIGVWDSSLKEFYLTKNKGSLGIAALANYNLISTRWKAEFDYKAGGGSGADGFVFMFYKSKSYGKPNYGRQLGFTSSVSVPGYGVEFDNNKNDFDSSSNHIAVIKDKVNNHLTRVNDLRTEDNLWHNAIIEFDNGKVVVKVDNNIVIDYTIASMVYTYSGVGFGAGTGGSNNNHVIKNFKLYEISTPSCTENWNCTSWSSCVNNVQTRTCTDLNNCGTTNNKPAESQSCVSCTDTCQSLGYECGNQLVCNQTVNCGSCSSGYTCVGGKCVQEAVNVTCTDSDGGLNYYIKGSITIDGVTKTDYCLDENFLQEKFCDNVNNYDNYYCPNGCSDGACKAVCKEGTSSFEILTIGAYGVYVKVPIKDGSASINVLYGDGTYFRHVADDDDGTGKLRTSSSENKITFDLDSDEYFVASRNSESYLLDIISIAEDTSVKKNYTTIKNVVTGLTICENKKQGDICKVALDLELTLGRINKNEKWAELTINSGGSFNKLYDTAGNYMFLPIQGMLPKTEFYFNVLDNSGNLIDRYKAYWSGGKVVVEEVCEVGNVTCTDSDDDDYSIEGGSCGSIDCNDNNAAINPSATEICDSLDNNCDGVVDEYCVECGGCLYEGSCLDYGIRLEINGTSSYCDISKQFLSQKGDGAECQNNYECFSNECGAGICVNTYVGVVESAGFMAKIWCKIINLPIFGGTEADYYQCLLRYV